MSNVVWDIVLPKLLFHMKPRPLAISWSHFDPKSIEIVPFHTDIKSSSTDNFLKKHTTSIFREPHEDTSSIFLWNTATHTRGNPNLRPHYVSSLPWKPEVNNLEVKMIKCVNGSSLGNWTTSTTLYSLPTQRCFVPLLSSVSFSSSNETRK